MRTSISVRWDTCPDEDLGPCAFDTQSYTPRQPQVSDSENERESSRTLCLVRTMYSHKSFFGPMYTKENRTLL
jgi:hypothetical protein